jgi:pyridoxal phosphate enzyme (YggS family)
MDVTSQPETGDAVAPADALAAVRGRIAAAARRAGRAPEEVRLVGVSKTVPLERVVAMAEAGLEDLGENHAAEMHRKAEALPNVRWHFLGKLQRGTVRHVADVASVVHSGEPGGALDALARRVETDGRTLDVLAQVDFTGERQGVEPGALEAFAERLQGMAGLRPVGLMTLPPLTATPEEARPYFARLRALRDDLSGRWPGLVELSMGMSGDYEVAVEEGATMVRVGTALFGRRPAKG